MRLTISNRVAIVASALSVAAMLWAASFVAANDETKKVESKGAPAASTNTITMVVMDPLAKPLSCPCVAGYAQRDYDLLGAALEKSLAQRGGGLLDEAKHFNHQVLPTMNKVREFADELEGYVADDLWPLPTYQEMLFIK